MFNGEVLIQMYTYEFAVARAPKVCIAVAIAHCRECVCGADGVNEEPRATKRDALWQADGKVGVVASDASA